jgi:putative membrane protein
MRFLIICLSLFLSSLAVAQQSKKAPAKKSTVKKTTTSKTSDNSFIVKAINGDLMKVELGSYADKYAAEQRVKNLGAMMARDHRRTKTEFKSIATDRNLVVPDEMDAAHKARVNAWEKKKGTDFDKHYIDMIVTDQAKDLAEYKRMVRSATDTHLKNFLPRAITLLRVQLDSAKAIQAFIKNSQK